MTFLSHFFAFGGTVKNKKKREREEFLFNMFLWGEKGSSLNTLA